MIAGGHVTLAVTDLGRAARFYLETLGMKLVAQNARTVTLDAGDNLIIVLLSGRRENRPIADLATVMPDTMIGLRAKGQLDDVVAVLENRGIVFVLQGTGPDRRAHFRDPDGNEFYLFSAPSP